MDEYSSSGNTPSANGVKPRPRDYKPSTVDISQLATQAVPTVKMRDFRYMPSAGSPIFLIEEKRAENRAGSVMRQSTSELFAEPPRRKFGGVIKIVPYSNAGVPIPGDGLTIDKGIQRQTGAAAKKSARKKQVSLAIRLVLTLLLFSFLFKSISWSSLLDAFTEMSWGAVLVSLVVGVVGVVVSAYQWRSLLLGEKIQVDLARLINLYMVGIGFSHFLPTGMGGDAVKALYVGRESNNSSGSASAVVMCRVTGFIGMVLIAFMTLLIWHESFTEAVITLFSLLSLLVGGMIGGALLSVSLLPRLLKRKWQQIRIVTSVMQVGNALSASVKRPRSLLPAIFYGVCFQAVAILNCYAYGNAVGIQVPLHFYCVAVPLIALVAFLPISINGYGLRESTYVYIFSTIHVHAATALLLALIQDVQTLIFGVIGGCIYFRLSGQTKRKAGDMKNISS